MSTRLPVPDGTVVSASTRSLHGGVQHRFTFANGYQASVVSHPFSYGGDAGLWELAVLNREGHIVYDTPVTSDVIGRLHAEELPDLLRQIADLPVLEVKP